MILTDSQDKKSYRPLLEWVVFKEQSGLNGSYADGWFFLVHSAFKSALDINFVERINKQETVTLRGKKSIELTGMSHDDYKANLKKDGIPLNSDESHIEIMGYVHKDLVETQGNPMLFSFRSSDSLESRCNKWSVQVDQAVSDSEAKQGNVGFNLYDINPNPKPVHSQGIWKKVKWYNIPQADFVDLLRFGKCSALNLQTPSNV